MAVIELPEEDSKELETLVLDPEFVIAKSPQAASTRIILEFADELGHYDADRLHVLVRDF